MSDLSQEPNPRAVPGDNNPPAPTIPAAPDLDLIEKAIRHDHARFFTDAEAWLASVERHPAVIADAAVAAKFAKTISELMKARTGAEKIHAGLKAPWFGITKKIDAIFLAGMSKRCEAAEAILVARQKVWLRKVEEDARKAQQAEAQRLQLEADKLKEEEAAKMREAEREMDAGNFDAAQEHMAEAAQVSESAVLAEQNSAIASDRAEGKVSDLVRMTHASGVTTSARKFWDAELLPLAALNANQELLFWRTLAPYIGPDVRLKAAKAAVKAGLRECPGLKIAEDFTPTNRG